MAVPSLEIQTHVQISVQITDGRLISSHDENGKNTRTARDRGSDVE